jgi:IclR family mhp operon transcriptional activator
MDLMSTKGYLWDIPSKLTGATTVFRQGQDRMPAANRVSRNGTAKPKLVKSLLKGLGCLSVVNKHSGLNVAQVAQRLNIPKSTAYRILETLCHGGYVVRDLDNLYRATSFVRTLSSGFDEEEWVLKIAHPELVALGKQFVWGVGIATPAGFSMHIRETTDRTSPLSLERLSAGAQLPMDSSSPGQVYLAYLSPNARAQFIAALKREPLQPGSPLHRPASFEARLSEIRRRGYAICQSGPKEAAVALPIFIGERVIACIGMHFIRRALSDQKVEEDFFPALKAAAARISAGLIENNYDFGREDAEPARKSGFPQRAAMRV